MCNAGNVRRSLLALAASKWVALGDSGRVPSFARFRMTSKGTQRKNSGILCRLHWMQRSVGQIAPRFLRKAQVWASATFRRSLRNAPSDRARRETLGRSVACSGMIRWRKTGERDNGLERWEEARGCRGVWRVALGSSIRVWLRIPVLTRRRSVVPSGASVQKGQGVKRWDAAELAASGGSRSEFGPRFFSRSLRNVV